MSMMSTLMTVMRKELRDLSRDRRTLLLTLLFGPLLYPVLLLGMGKLAESRVRTQIEQPLQIPTIGADNAPNLVRFLAAQGLNTAPAPKDLAEAGTRIQVTAGLPPSGDRSISDVWSALGGELKPSIDVVLTVPFDTERVAKAGPPLEELHMHVEATNGPQTDSVVRPRRR